MVRLHALMLLMLAAPAVAAAVPAPEPVPDARPFPAGFVWGTATAAVQVEGDTPHSDWAEFETRPGAIRGSHRIGQAARHFDLYEEDFREARAMRTNGYRFSLEWSRLEPRRGEWNRAAEARYRRMLESLRAKGIRPMVTLHHFSNPTWVAAQGGWENPATITAFEGFVRRVGAAYGHLVDDWITFNEPTIYASEGYFRGVFPPGRANDLVALPRVLGHLARAHGQA
ncbi:MAG: family 1 glycosylhydrolase, partial [Candidatus Sericytochromatia bacterium]